MKELTPCSLAPDRKRTLQSDPDFLGLWLILLGRRDGYTLAAGTRIADRCGRGWQVAAEHGFRVPASQRSIPKRSESGLETSRKKELGEKKPAVLGISDFGHQANACLA